VSLAAAPDGLARSHVPATAPVRRLGSGPSGVPSPAPVYPGASDRPARCASRAPRRSLTRLSNLR